MKRKVSILLILCALVLALTTYAKISCYLCGKKSEKEHTSTVFDEEVTIYDDCKT